MLAALLVVALFAASRPLANYIKEEIEGSVNRGCEPCLLKIGALHLRLLPSRLELENVTFEQGDPRDSSVSFEAKVIAAQIPFRNITGAPWRINQLNVRGLSVTLREGDFSLPKKEPKPGAEEESGLPAFSCGGISVVGGAFTYRKDSVSGSAYLKLTNVSAEISSFGSTEEWKSRGIKGQADATLEQSGKVELTAFTRLDLGAPHVDVDLKVSRQRLIETAPFFRVEEGVKLEGTLIDSKSVIKVRDKQAEGVMEATYSGLKVTFYPNHKRGALKAVINNLAASVALNKGNQTEPRPERDSAVVTARHKKESVVSWILRTLKEAVLRVATN